MKRLLRKGVSLLCALLCIVSLSAPALAYTAIDTSREAALTIYFGKDKTGFSGVELRMYRVADVSKTAQFTLTGDFTEYPVTVKGLDSAGWRALAQTLDGYVARDGLTPAQAARTGADGRVIFNGLSTGLYLVVGDRFQEGRYTYTPEPFLLCLPNLDKENDTWLYDTAVSCKYDSNYHPPGGGDGDDDDDTINRKVLKVWRDDGNKVDRPDEIVVQLLRDGEIYDTVTLSEENNWRYTWSDLDQKSQWRVVEYETPEGYTVSVVREGITFVMTNTHTEEIPDEPTPGGDVPPPPETNIPDEPTPQGPGPGGPDLPQTGVLWWPVSLLACGGLFLFLIGWGIKRHEKNKTQA